MAWNIDMVLMLRSIIGDLDKTTFTNERLKQILVIGAYNVYNDANFSIEYTIDVGGVTISPDPISESDSDFASLTVYRSACILVGSEDSQGDGTFLNYSFQNTKFAYFSRRRRIYHENGRHNIEANFGPSCPVSGVWETCLG